MVEHTERKIRDRAYQLWEANGREEGQDWNFWLQAEKEILGDSTGAVLAEPVTPAPAPEQAAAPENKPAAKRKPAAKKTAAAKPKAPAKPRATKASTTTAKTNGSANSTPVS